MKRLLCMLLLTLTACVPGTEGDVARPSPSGPPMIDYDLVRQHALQFDVDIPSRPPGSQHELAAATYILGHLQLAGYGPTLSAVPVADQVQSTNVVAFPPNGMDPELLVLIEFATDGRGPPQGAHLGLFLELARALNALAPDHRAGFVALGGGDGASEILATFLDDRGVEPQAIFIIPGPTGGYGGAFGGACAGGALPTSSLVEDLSSCGDALMNPVLDPVVAGSTRAEGVPRGIGDELLRFLATTAE